MQSKPGIYCIFLVSALYLVHLQAQARAIQDSSPALIIDDGGEQSVVGEKRQLPPSLGGSDADKEKKEEPASVVAPVSESSGNASQLALEKPAIGSQSPTLVAYETTLNKEQNPEVAAQSPSIDISSAQPPKSSDSTSQSSQPAASGSPTTSPTAQQATSTGSVPAAIIPVATEKDLKSLLESKNDSENDLASPPQASPTSPKATPRDELDLPVETSNGKPNNDDRFHYSVSSDKSGSPVASNGESPAADDEEDDAADESADQPLEGKKDVIEAEQQQPSTTLKPVEQTASSVLTTEAAIASSEKPAEKVLPTVESVEKKDDPKEVETKKEVASTENKVEPQASSEPVPPLEEAHKAEKPSGASIPSIEEVKQEDKSSSSPDVMTSKDQPASKEPEKQPAKEAEIPATTTSSSASKEADSTIEAKKDVSVKDDATKSLSKTEESKTLAGPMTSEVKKDENVEVSKAEQPAQKTSSSSSTTSTQAPVSKSNIEPLVQSVATSAAAAAGSALGTAVVSGLSPAVSKASPTTSTTQAPSQTSISSTTTTTTKSPNSRKSTTDRWNRWLTRSSSTTDLPAAAGSSTSLPPRRKLVPSIRRRFRPHNRFSPYGPDAYTPLESSDDSGYPEALGPSSHSDKPKSSSTGSTVTLKPRRRTSTTTEPNSSTHRSPGIAPSEDVGSSSESEPGKPSSRRRHQTPSSFSPHESGSRRKYNNDDDQDSHHHHHHHRHHQHNHRHHHDRDRNDHRHHPHHQADAYPDFSSISNRRRQNSNPSRHNQSPFYSSGFDPFSPSMLPFKPSSFSNSVGGLSPFSGPGFSLFNSVGGSSLGSTSSSPGSSSGFDLLNPFSWIDEVTKPIRNNRPHSNPPHLGSPGRAPGQPPVALEGEYGSGNEARPLSPNQHHPHREHGHRPSTSGSVRPSYGRPGIGRDDYQDDYHHDHHHCHGHEHEGEHEQDEYSHRPPRRPVRPPFNDYRPNDYERPNYGGHRPDRPYRRGEEPSTSSNEGTIIIRGESDSSDQDTLRSHSPRSPALKPTSSERVSSSSNDSGLSRSSSSSSAVSQPTVASGDGAARRVASVFSPFDSLFGSIDDDLFGGGLRSSFIDAPMKAAADTMRQADSALDAIVSSPKIALSAGGSPQSAVASSANNGKVEKDISSLISEGKQKQHATSVQIFDGQPVVSGDDHKVETEPFWMLPPINSGNGPMARLLFGTSSNRPNSKTGVTPDSDKSTSLSLVDADKSESKNGGSSLTAGIRYFFLML